MIKLQSNTKLLSKLMTQPFQEDKTKKVTYDAKVAEKS